MRAGQFPAPEDDGSVFLKVPVNKLDTKRRNRAKWKWTWIMGAIGGLIIGTAGALYLLVNGRIMGASGSHRRHGGRLGLGAPGRDRLPFILRGPVLASRPWPCGRPAPSKPM